MIKFGKIIFSLLFLVISVVFSFGQKVNFDLNSQIPLNPDVIYGKLANGLTYYILHNEMPENRAELTLAVKTGSVMEDDDQQGFAHFNEHMAFNGTKNFPKHELVNYLESIGMKFGPEVNAYTGFDETVYGIQVPLDSTRFLDKGLAILADWAQNVSLEDDEINKERGVIQEEWRMGRGAEDRMMRKNFPVILFNSKYAQRLPIGQIDQINDGSVDAVKRFYKDWYRPDMMAVIVVGDFDVKMMEEKIKTVFSAIPRSVNQRERVVFSIPDHDQTLVTIATDKEAQATTVEIFYKHPDKMTETVGDYKEKLMASLYGMMLNNRLNELTMQETPPFVLGYSVYTSFIGPKDVYLSIAVARNNDAKTALKAIMIENEKVKRFGFTATELERMKSAMIRTMETMYNERKKMESNNLAQELVRNFLFTKEPVPGLATEFEYYKKLVPEITLDNVNQLAKDWITDKNRVFVVNAPDDPNIKVPTEEEIFKLIDEVKNEKIEAYVDKEVKKVLISKDPVAGKIEKTKKNKKLGSEEWTLSNGVKVVLKTTDFKSDEIRMTAYSQGGYSLCTLKDNISARVTTDVITECGLGDFGKIELDKYLSDKIVSVYPYIDELTEGFDGSSSPKDFETMLQMIYLYFTQPRQDTAAFKSYISKQKSVLENKRTSPEAAFRDTISVIKSQHSLFRKPMSDKLLDDAKLKRIMYIFKERFGDPSGFTFFFVGNIDLKTVRPLIEKYLGGLPTVNRTETYKDLNIRKPEGVVKKSVYKGSEPKSMVYLDFHGKFEYTPDNLTNLDLICEILDTKLIESIREEKSGVYTIGAYPSTGKYPDVTYSTVIFFPCAPDNIDRLTSGVLEEMDKLSKNGPSEADLTKGKEKLIRQRETSERDNGFWVRSLKNIYYYNEDVSAFLNYKKYVNKVSAEKMKEAAGKFFNRKNYIQISLLPESSK